VGKRAKKKEFYEKNKVELWEKQDPEGGKNTHHAILPSWYWGGNIKEKSPYALGVGDSKRAARVLETHPFDQGLWGEFGGEARGKKELEQKFLLEKGGERHPIWTYGGEPTLGKERNENSINWLPEAEGGRRRRKNGDKKGWIRAQKNG